MTHSEGPRISILIEEKKKNQVKLKALKQGKTMTQVIAELLEKWLKD